MNRRGRIRTISFITLIALIMGLFTFRLYKLQSTVDAEELMEADSLWYYTTVEAARGQILDRNGTVLGSNRASYNIVIISYVLFNGPTPNESLLELIQLCDALGIELESHFPVTETRPYAYTLDNYDENWQDYFRKFLRSNELDTDITAGSLMRVLREKYNLPEDVSDEMFHRLVSVRYELELRGIKNMPLENYVLARDVTAEQLSAIIELDIPGVIVDTTTVREYKTEYASHLLGFTGDMNWEEYDGIYRDLGYAMNAKIGKDGVEKAFEEYLHGTDGQMKTVVTADGEILEQYYTKVPQPGANVELTIDLDLQIVAANALEDVILDLRENGIGVNKGGMDAKGGAVVVQDVKTGEILASVSYPTFPMDVFQDREAYAEMNADEEYYPLMDRARLLAYPPGSIYKMVSAIAAIDYANINRYFPVTDLGEYGKYSDLGFAPRCYIFTSTGATHGTVNMMEALRDSCNYYFYEVGLMTNTWDVDYVAKQLGLGEDTGSELAEAMGKRANPDTKAATFYGTDQQEWVDGDRLQAAIGQSLNAFTPLQMVCYTSALANGGTRYEATFLRRVVSWDFQELLVESKPTVASELDISKEAMTCITEGMTMAAHARVGLGDPIDGTASAYLYDYPVKVAAKTGTAQHGDGKSSDNASFVAFAPADDPQVAIAVYVEQGSQGGNLGQIVRAVLDEYFSQTGKYETLDRENYTTVPLPMYE